MRSPAEIAKYITRRIRWWWQRRTRGYDDKELWSLDWTIAKFIRPRLEGFKASLHGYPAELTRNIKNEDGDDEGFSEWEEIIDKMIIAFQFIEADDGWEFNKEQEKQVKEGLDLFRYWFFALWT